MVRAPHSWYFSAHGYAETRPSHRRRRRHRNRDGGASPGVTGPRARRSQKKWQAGYSRHATDTRARRFDNSVALGVLGELCITFCFENIPKDPALLECAITAKEMVAVNAAVGELAVMDSPRLGGVARAALAVYDNCEAVCRKHEAHHEICRQCADQCTAIKAAIAAIA